MKKKIGSLRSYYSHILEAKSKKKNEKNLFRDKIKKTWLGAKLLITNNGKKKY